VFGPELQRLRRQRLLREIRDRASAQGRTITINGKEFINFASNDYLGLANHPAPKEAAIEALRKFGTGAGASRLLSGGCVLHAKLEGRLAAFKGTEAALLFTSGYAANTGIIPAIAESGDAIFSDELNHASIIDGCRLSRAETHIYRHADAGHLESLLGQTEARRKIVVTDSVFSMDGDIAPLPDICGLCVKHDAILFMDDAHGTGVLGGGRGALAHFGIRPEPWIIQMGTLSKALGSLGGFVAGSRKTVEWLVNSARSFIFSTALPAPVVAASLSALKILEGDTSLVEKLRQNIETLTVKLKGLGLDTGKTESPIVPVILKSAGEALEMSARLLEEGIYAPAIRPPTVREPRLRLTVTALHTEEDIERLAAALEKTLNRG
jgi:8-amino-7-oxononanoate synthase